MKTVRIGHRGFTLLEILVALAVLGIAVVVVFQLFSANTRSLSDSNEYAAAVVRAETRMREILSSEILKPQIWTEMTGDGYRIDVTVAETLQSRTEGLPVQMFEVTLALYWKRGPKEKSITFSSMKLMTRAV